MTGVRDPFVVNLNWHPAYSTSILPEGYDYETLPDHWKKLLEKVDPEQGMPKFKNIHFRDVKATGAKTCVKVGGLKESTIENFSLTNVSIEGKNAGKISYAKDWKTDNFSVKAENGELEMENNKNIDL
jgi:hypothetical protein